MKLIFLEANNLLKIPELWSDGVGFEPRQSASRAYPVNYSISLSSSSEALEIYAWEEWQLQQT